MMFQGVILGPLFVPRPFLFPTQWYRPHFILIAGSVTCLETGFAQKVRIPPAVESV
jgi:hypothetical protein